MRKYLLLAASVLFVLAGILLAFYPWIADYYYEHTLDSVVTSYEKQMDEIDHGEYEEMLSDAERYNEGLWKAKVRLRGILTEDEEELDDAYWNLLNPDDAGVIGFVEIPELDVYLPVYHGTSDEVLQKGIGHIEGTSLPVGGESTHTVLAGHSGLNSKKLFTDLTLMKKGDIFLLHVMDRILAYRVTKISTVLPEDTSQLRIEAGKDLATLLTCTPYGVNTYRLLVTGERTEYEPELLNTARKVDSADSDVMKTWVRAIALAAVLFVVLLTGYILFEKRKEAGNRTKDF